MTIESEELWIVRRPTGLARAQCSQCAERGAMTTLEEAVALTGVSSRLIHRLAEAGQIHFTETLDRLLLVCLDSLLLQMAGNPKRRPINSGLRGPP